MRPGVALVDRRIEQNRKKSRRGVTRWLSLPLAAESPPKSRLTVALALTGFVAVAVAQVTNMILARANAGAIPPFSLAFFRWLIVAAGLAPFVWAELKAKADVLLSARLRSSCWPASSACSFAAGRSTSPASRPPRSTSR